MHQTHSAHRPSSRVVQERGDVSASASPVKDRHTTAQALSLSSRQQTPPAVTTPEPASTLADFTTVQYRGLLWATAGDRAVVGRLAHHPHQVQVPAWTCVLCQLAWPCMPARSNLLQALGWIKVATFSAALMDLAVKDLRTLNPEQLWKQFIEWTEPSTAARESLFPPTS